MAGFRVTVNSAQVQHLLSKLSATIAEKVVIPGLKIITADTEAAVKDRMSGRTLKVRSNTYRQSVLRTPPRSQNGRMSASVYSDFIGNWLLEKGGTVRPTNRKVLTIPVPGGGALTPAGAKRFTAPQALRAGAFFVSAMASRTSGGFQRNRLVGGLIAKTTGKGRRIIPLFALKGHATIRPHPIWGPVAESSRLLAVQTIERVLTQVIGALDSIGGKR
jgi:hypothetical protein